MVQTTRTINKLHFSDLDPLRFEDLCFEILSRLENFKVINHFGRKGSDDGIDILAIKKENEIEITWGIQCKRYLTITKSDIKKIIDKIVSSCKIPDKLLVIVSCDVNKAVYQYINDYSKENGISDSEIWAASDLESKLYNDMNDLLIKFFGIQLENKTISNEAKIKYSNRMEKRVFKELIDHKYIKEAADKRQFAYDPSRMFISSEVIIRSVDDTTYPERAESKSNPISPWFKINFYEKTNRGIEFWLNGVSGTMVIMDSNGYWEPLIDYYDKRKENPKYQIHYAKRIGLIPYYNIVEINKDGDEFDSIPHLYCRFNINGMPYEEIYYKYYGDPQKGIPDRNFDRKKQTVFPKE